MPRKTNSETRAAILALFKNGLSCKKISDRLPELKLQACKSTVALIIKEYKLEQQGITKPARKLGTQHLPSVRTPAFIRKVKNLVHRPDPWSIRAISRKLGASYKTIWNTIRKDLGGKLRHKTRTHHLNNLMVAQRVAKAPRLLKHLKGGKWKYIVSIDEAWVYLSHVNGRRKVFYEFRGNKSPQSWLKYMRQLHPRGVMFVAGISWL